jgi:hypothetical protein
MKIEEVEANLNHVIELGQNLRLEDKREVVAKTGEINYKDVISNGWLKSDYSRTVLVNGQVAFVWGVCSSPEDPKIGSPYMLSTPLIEQIPITIGRRCKPRIEEMIDKYSILFNYIDSRNKLHLNFIKHCGFEIINDKVFNDVKFYGFFKSKEKIN